jgi:hypothetical protein
MSCLFTPIWACRIRHLVPVRQPLIGYTWSYFACSIRHLVPVRQPLIGYTWSYLGMQNTTLGAGVAATHRILFPIMCAGLENLAAMQRIPRPSDEWLPEASPIGYSVSYLACRIGRIILQSTRRHQGAPAAGRHALGVCLPACLPEMPASVCLSVCHPDACSGPPCSQAPKFVRLPACLRLEAAAYSRICSRPFSGCKNAKPRSCSSCLIAGGSRAGVRDPCAGGQTDPACGHGRPWPGMDRTAATTLFTTSP